VSSTTITPNPTRTDKKEEKLLTEKTLTLAPVRTAESRKVVIGLENCARPANEGWLLSLGKKRFQGPRVIREVTRKVGL